MAFREIIKTAFSSQVLPIDGAWAYGESIPCNQFTDIDFLIAYTPDPVTQAAGTVIYSVEWSVDNRIWYQVCEVQAPIIAPGSDCVDTAQRVEISYTTTTAGVERFMAPTFEIAANFVRIKIKDSNSANPGTAEVLYYLNGETI
jgi:hypothetical protein